MTWAEEGLLTLPDGLPELLPIVCKGKQGFLALRDQSIVRVRSDGQLDALTPVRAGKFEADAGITSKKWKSSLKVAKEDGTPGPSVGKWLHDRGVNTAMLEELQKNAEHCGWVVDREMLEAAQAVEQLQDVRTDTEATQSDVSTHSSVGREPQPEVPVSMRRRKRTVKVAMPPVSDRSRLPELTAGHVPPSFSGVKRKPAAADGRPVADKRPRPESQRPDQPHKQVARKVSVADCLDSIKRAVQEVESLASAAERAEASLTQASLVAAAAGQARPDQQVQELLETALRDKEQRVAAAAAAVDALKQQQAVCQRAAEACRQAAQAVEQTIEKMPPPEEAELQPLLHAVSQSMQDKRRQEQQKAALETTVETALEEVRQAETVLAKRKEDCDREHSLVRERQQKAQQVVASAQTTLQSAVNTFFACVQKPGLQVVFGTSQAGPQVEAASPIRSQ